MDEGRKDKGHLGAVAREASMKEYFDYSIRSMPRVQAESGETLGAKFLHSLDALNHIDPTIFANWEVMNFPAHASLSLAAARPRIGAIVEANVTRDDEGQPSVYYGYSCVAFTDNATKSRNVTLRIKAGGKQTTAFGCRPVVTGWHPILPC
jgi:hypothetical protein